MEVGQGGGGECYILLDDLLSNLEMYRRGIVESLAIWRITASGIAAILFSLHRADLNKLRNTIHLWITAGQIPVSDQRSLL